MPPPGIFFYLHVYMLDIIKIFILLLLFDAPYLYFIGPYYKNMIETIQKTSMSVDKYSAILCYILLTLGLYIFIVRKKATLFEAFLLGFIIYGVYETTSYALIKKWSPQILIIDSIWGGCLFALVYFAYKKLK